MHNVAEISQTKSRIRPFYINGEWREGSSAEVDNNYNPATGKVCAVVAQASAEDVDEAISAAHAARHGWAKLLVSERETILLKAADLIAERADEIRDIIIEETGSTLLKAPWEVGYAIDCLRSAAAWTRQAHGETFPTCSPGQIGMTVRQPLGVIAGIGGTQRLTRYVGKSKSMDMHLTGRFMDAEEAERAGLVSRVVPAKQLMDEAHQAAAKIAEKSVLATMAAKQAVNRAYETTLTEGLMAERSLFQSLFATEDQKEGMAAFLEKRTAQFRDR